MKCAELLSARLLYKCSLLLLSADFICSNILFKDSICNQYGFSGMVLTHSVGILITSVTF